MNSLLECMPLWWWGGPEKNSHKSDEAKNCENVRSFLSSGERTNEHFCSPRWQGLHREVPPDCRGELAKDHMMKRSLMSKMVIADEKRLRKDHWWGKLWPGYPCYRRLWLHHQDLELGWHQSWDSQSGWSRGPSKKIIMTMIIPSIAIAHIAYF